MADINIRRCTVAELEAVPDAADFVAEYASESGLPELGPPCVQKDTYYKLEAAGVLYPIGAFDEERLVGFILPIIGPLPHYGAIVGTIESVFVPASERKDGVWIKLREHAEALARQLGARALFISAPVGSRLARVMARTAGYRHSNDIFVTSLT